VRKVARCAKCRHGRFERALRLAQVVLHVGQCSDVAHNQPRCAWFGDDTVMQAQCHVALRRTTARRMQRRDAQIQPGLSGAATAFADLQQQVARARRRHDFFQQAEQGRGPGGSGAQRRFAPFVEQ
jgi:hypothetical protein